MLLWANLHPGFIVGLAVIESFLAVEVLRDIYTKAERRESYKKVLIMILSFAAVFINPYGAHIFSVLFATTKQTILLRVVQEWQKIKYVPNNTAINFTYFYFALTVISTIYIIKQIATSKSSEERFNNIKFLILLILGGYLVMMAYRNIQLFFILTILPVAISMKSIIPNKKVIRKVLLIITFILVSILIRSFTKNVILKPSKDWFKREYPVGACDFIQRNHLRGNLYNQYNDGYYLLYRLYPTVKVSIYGTFSIHDEVSFLTNEMNLLHPASDLKFLDEMNVNMVLLNYGYSSSSPIFYFLYNNPNWALVYWDDFGMLFLRNTAAYSEIIRKNEYKYAIPIESIEYGLLNEGKEQEIVREINRKLREEPDCLKALSILSSINLIKNNLFEVIKINKKILKIAPLHDGAYFNIGYAYLKAGQYSEAERYFKKAIELNPKNPEFYVQLGYAFIGQKRFYKAETQFLTALQLNYADKNVYLGMSKLYLYMGKNERAQRLFETYNNLAQNSR